MKPLRILTAVLAAWATLAATSARASLVAIGEPQSGNSWYQQFREDGNDLYGHLIGVINHMEVFYIAGSTFENPAFSAFNVAGWSSSGIVADGSPLDTSVQSLFFNLTWNDPRVAPTVFDFYAWNGSILKDAARATWNGSWSFAKIPANELHVAPVPEPATMIAGVLLLLPFGASTIMVLWRKRAV